MAIKNKDGTIYKLKKPNPLSKKQDFWADTCDYVLHNCHWDSDIIISQEDADQISDFLIPDVIVEKGPPVIAKESIVSPPTETPSPPAPEVEEKSEVIKKPAIPNSVLKNSIIFWCLPTMKKIKEDELYGETHQTTQYGEKFTFEAIMLKKNDLEIQFWTTAELVEKGAIVYPSRYTHRREDYKDYRWWEVQATINKSGGRIMHAILSNITPDFSD